MIIDPSNIFDYSFITTTFSHKKNVEPECQNIGPLTIGTSQNKFIIAFTGSSSDNLAYLTDPNLIRTKVSGPYFSQEFRVMHSLKSDYNSHKTYSIQYPIQQHGNITIDTFCLNTFISQTHLNIKSSYNFENYTIFESNNSFYSACFISNQLSFKLSGFLHNIPNISIPYSIDIENNLAFLPKTAIYISNLDNESLPLIQKHLTQDISTFLIKTEQNKNFLNRYFSNIDPNRIEVLKNECYQKIIVF